MIKHPTKITDAWLIKNGAGFVREIREKLGITQAELAEELGVTARTISSLETDSSVLQKTTYMALMYLRHEYAHSCGRLVDL